MSVWSRIKEAFTLAPPAAELTRTDSGGVDAFAVHVIDGVAVPGQDMLGSFYRPGMMIPGAWRCAILLSDLLGAIPWYAYRQRGGLPIEQLDPTPLLLEQPNPQETGMATRSSWGLDLIWHGNAVGIIAARTADNQPWAVLPVPARMCGVRRQFEHGVLPRGAIEYDIGGIRFGQHEVFHIKGPHEPGEVRGVGVLEQHFDTLNLARDQQRQARSVATHGVPTGLLKVTNPDASEDDLKAAKKGWLDSQRDRTIAALNATTDFEPLAWNPTEMQMIEARKYTLHELALIFGLPLSMLGVETSSRTYRNDETESINLLKYSLGGHVARYEQTYSLHLPHRTWAKANLGAVLRADTLSRFQAHGIALENGFKTKDEVRREEDLPPLGDEADEVDEEGNDDE